MSKLRLTLSMSLDGYVAGRNPSVEQPLGEGGEELHRWALALAIWQKSHGREGGEQASHDTARVRAAAG